VAYSVYIIQAGDGSYYIGQTGDIRDRLRRHMAGQSLSTKRRQGWKLVYQQEFDTRVAAVRREREIKGRKSRVYIDRLIRPSRL
jgi:putative endonuclease